MRRPIVLMLMLLAACSTAAPPTEVAVVPIRLINFWDIQTDSLTPDDAVRDWQFVGKAGDNIHVSVRADVNVPLVVSLRAMTTVLAEGREMQFTLPSEGAYTVRVQLLGDSSATYTISLTYTDRPTPVGPSPSPTETLTPAPSNTPTPTTTLTASHTPTLTHTLTATFTPSPTFTPSDTPTTTHTPTPIYERLGTYIGTLTNGLAVTGTLISSFERHIYTFESSGQEYATLQMVCASGACPEGGIDPVVTLYDPLGAPVAMDDNTNGGGGALLRNILLPAAGTYYVQAVSGSGTGDYVLSLSLSGNVSPYIFAATITPTNTPVIGTATPLPGGEQLYDHVPVSGRIEHRGDFKRFFIVAQPAEIVTIAASPAPESPLLPHLQIVNPGGEVLFDVPARADNGGDALVPALGLLEGGVYSIFVTADGNTTGDFIISYGRGSSHRDVMRGEALPDQEYASAIERRGLRDVWTILLHRDDVITASVRTQNPGFNPALELVTPNGTILARGDDERDNINPVIQDVRAPVTGLYHLRVTGVNAGTFGPYQLFWQRTQPAPTATARTASYPILTADDIVPSQTYLDYPFQGFAGQRVAIQVIAISPELDPVAALIAPDGAVIAQGDDSENSLNPIFEAVLPVTGTYLLRINGYNGTTGAVEVLVEGLLD